MVLILFLYHCVPFDADIFSHQRRFVKAFCALKTEQRESRREIGKTIAFLQRFYP